MKNLLLEKVGENPFEREVRIMFYRTEGNVSTDDFMLDVDEIVKSYNPYTITIYGKGKNCFAFSNMDNEYMKNTIVKNSEAGNILNKIEIYVDEWNDKKTRKMLEDHKSSIVFDPVPTKVQAEFARNRHDILEKSIKCLKELPEKSKIKEFAKRYSKALSKIDDTSFSTESIIESLNNARWEKGYF